MTLTPVQISAVRKRLSGAYGACSSALSARLSGSRQRRFAKLRMAQDLGFSEEVFGLGIGMFFIGYLVLEIHRCPVGGTVECAEVVLPNSDYMGIYFARQAFVTTPAQFNTVRFFLGVAEAGFFPGIIVYFTHWFRSSTAVGQCPVSSSPYHLALLSGPLSPLCS